jgi:hypothetical protein
MNALIMAPLAAIIGALIGGFTTFVAGRMQWRRETRREAYAQVLTTSHEVAWWLRGEESREAQPGEADRRLRFLAAIDAASLFASYRVQWVLDDWRPLAEEVARRSSVDSGEVRFEPELATEWTAHQLQLMKQAKLELGIRGQRQYWGWMLFFGWVSIPISFTALFFLYELDSAADPSSLSQFVPSTDSQWYAEGVVLLWVGIGLLALSSVAAFRSRSRLLSAILGIAAGIISITNPPVSVPTRGGGTILSLSVFTLSITLMGVAMFSLRSWLKPKWYNLKNLLDRAIVKKT